jgi:hypothetical protein
MARISQVGRQLLSAVPPHAPAAKITGVEIPFPALIPRCHPCRAMFSRRLTFRPDKSVTILDQLRRQVTRSISPEGVGFEHSYVIDISSSTEPLQSGWCFPNLATRSSYSSSVPMELGHPDLRENFTSSNSLQPPTPVEDAHGRLSATVQDHME